ncbi:PRP1 splicing factor, N-terminal-domain-containing protein [Crepidotus variabilis]|uniref:PRP1 splicing factor, N-terminal-domain-containing protein n=1 Tax=Crepidotus variabilis TaxID=179855 RepID=A0A9P6EAX7_9AGAR|nr:PRP1 splicing factor, N-terminal-domain-containing protein [Crepidotus variabilis]
MASGKSNKLAFLSMPAPASYVAGLGRGASGFTTRSDIGPAREGPSAEVVAEAQAKRGEEQEVDPDQFQDPDNEYGLFAGTTYEADDEEADKIYDKVDQAMDSRRKARREAQEQEEMAKVRAERPKIQQQFADLKRGLSAVTDTEWESIPEVGNLTRKKRRREERTYVVPDSVLVGDRSKNEYENSLDTREQNGGFGTSTDSGSLTNFVEIGQARDKILSLKLDQTSAGIASSGTSTSVDPKGYLTSLDSVIIKSDAEIGDIKRARLLFDSLIKSNPKHAPGWIAAACLEEHAGKMVAARKLIKQGCENCPKNEDVWLEAARLHNNDDAKVVLANAVQHVGQSVKVWLAAADLESDVKAKKPLENIPNSVRLWKETVNLESSAVDARILLARAVEVIPLSVELWLALARLETPDNARAVLNKARKSVPTSHEIWIAAGRLLEQQANSKPADQREKELEKVDKTIEAAVHDLRRHQVLLTRDQWLKEAEKCEEEGSVRTCEAIIKATVAMEIEEEDRYDTWLGDAENADARGKVGSARAILAYALKVFPDRKNLWRRAAELEKVHGTRDSLDAILSRAVVHCPQAEVLWLMAAKEKWLAGDVPAAREVLERAFIANPESEQIWLAAVKLEAENGEFAVARELLIRARTVADTERIWMKSAVFERQQGQLDAALQTLEQAIKKFPKFAKLYMIQGQIHQDQHRILAARASFAAGLKSCAKEPTLWTLASGLEEADGKSIKARALLEKARLVNPANELLWAESVGVEERSGGAVQAKAMLSRALQECPASGVLWSLALWAEPRASRKTKSVDALRKTKDHPLVVCTVARVLWADRAIERARDWFGRATATDPDLGDIWAWWLKFEKQHGTEEHREAVRIKCVAADPHHSPLWQSIAKDVKNTRKTVREILELVVDQLK